MEQIFLLNQKRQSTLSEQLLLIPCYFTLMLDERNGAEEGDSSRTVQKRAWKSSPGYSELQPRFGVCSLFMLCIKLFVGLIASKSVTSLMLLCCWLHLNVLQIIVSQT